MGPAGEARCFVLQSSAMASAAARVLSCAIGSLRGERAMPRRTQILAAMTLAAVAGFTGPADAQDVYAGKTIRVIVGLQSGGSADAFVRGFTGHLRRYLPGNPNLVIQNVTGAGGNAAINYLAERADKDGLTILFSPYHP